MAMTTMPVPVDAPQAAPPKSGLIEAVRQIGRLHEGMDVHIGNGGVTYRPEAAGPGQYALSPRDTTHRGNDVYTGEGADPKGSGISGVTGDLVNGYPVILTAEESCSAFGWNAANYVDRVKRRMAARESAILEREFWTGEVAKLDGLDPAVYQWLAQESAVDLTPVGGALDPRKALGVLEDALGRNGVGSGFLHMTRRAAIMMPDRWGDGPIITWPDSVVAIGAGYTGTGPDGADPAAGESWVYATDLCDVWLDDVQIFPTTFAEAFDRRKNTIAYRAQRFGVATWDGDTHVAIRVTI